MAEIFLASVHGPEGFVKEVVIKRIRAHLATEPSFVEMFVSEARLASRLNHPNIVQIFDFDRVGDTYYLAMEYVRGRSLAQLLKRAFQHGQPPGPMLVAHICLELLRGLGYAHRLTEAGRPLGLVHRDVTRAQHPGVVRGRSEARGLRHRQAETSGHHRGNAEGQAGLYVARAVARRARRCPDRSLRRGGEAGTGVARSCRRAGLPEGDGPTLGWLQQQRQEWRGHDTADVGITRHGPGCSQEAGAVESQLALQKKGWAFIGPVVA